MQITKTRAWRAALAAALLAFGAPLVALVPTAPAGAVGTGADCGGADTPPAFTLTSGTTCNGSLDEPHASTTSDLNGNSVFHYADRYEFNHTDADQVQVSFSGTSCMTANPASGTFIASGSGPAPLDVTARRNATPGGAPLAPCPDQPDDYTVRVTVTPNDRPAVNPTSVPTSFHFDETITFEVSGTDPDGNLSSLGIRYGGPGQDIEWQTQLLPSASWSTTFQKQANYSYDVTFFSRDSLGAISPPSATYFITLIQNDCGFGHDAVVEPVTLPLHCDGWSAGSEVDSFTFTLPADTRARVRTLVGFLQGFTVTLTSPSGVATSSGADDFISFAEAGTWRLDMQSDGDTQSYVLDVREIGLAAPPVLVLSHSPVTHQGDVFQLPMTGFDPNDETLRYRVDWSDGIGANYPLDDSRALSGQTVTAERRFWLTTPTSISGTVTVTNSEGLTDTEPFSVSIVLHSDCGFGTPTYDAPDSGTVLRTMPASGVCSGTVGHSLFNPPWSPDVSDHYKSSHSCSLIEACKLRATLTTSPGLAATVQIDNNVQRAATSCGFGGCTTSVELIGPSFPSGNHPQLWVTADGGQGAYTVRIEKVALLP